MLIACAVAIGSKSLNRRAIVIFTFFAIFITYFILRSKYSTGLQDNLWLSSLNDQQQQQHLEEEHVQDILGVSLCSAVVFASISLVSKYPLPLDTSFCSFFLGCIFSTSTDLSAVYSHFKFLIISYLIMPMISGCFTWLIYRIFIKGILYADPEEKFRLTLSWCGFFYPLALAALVSACALINFIQPDSSFFYKIISGLLIFVGAYAFSHGLFKLFLRAWLKRRAFLLYPQEYAVYMERSEKVEQGDREARGLGPIRDYYYLPKSSTTSVKPNPSQSIKDSNSAVLQISTISPAVIAGKLAIISKRSEELFRPINNFMAVVLLFLVSSFESFNLMAIVKKATGLTGETPPFLLWPALLLILIGGLIFSHRSGIYFGKNIIRDMRFSQAFAIQLGTLLTLTFVLFLHTIPPAPMWYLLASVTAVSTSTYNDKSTTVIAEDDSDSEGENKESFRYKLGLIVFFWASAIVFGFCSGSIYSYLYKARINNQQ